MSQVQMNYIAGEWLEGESTVNNINPSNHSELVGEFAQASAAQVDQAINAARQAQLVWQATGLEAKQRVLQASLVKFFPVKKASHVQKAGVKFIGRVSSFSIMRQKF
jgi:delta 1-pyrroline-5-carboxylate dehydrogenase